MTRFIAAILAVVFTFTGTGAARHAHGREVDPQRQAQVSEAVHSAAFVAQAHDGSHCAVCVAIAASQFAYVSRDVDSVGERLIARQLAIDGRRDSAAVPERRPCRDPPIV